MRIQSILFFFNIIEYIFKILLYIPVFHNSGWEVTTYFFFHQSTKLSGNWTDSCAHFPDVATEFQ